MAWHGMAWHSMASTHVWHFLCMLCNGMHMPWHLLCVAWLIDFQRSISSVVGSNPAQAGAWR
eukprot:11194056-Lingulodinium_polyedra.AAC.1